MATGKEVEQVPVNVDTVEQADDAPVPPEVKPKEIEAPPPVEAIAPDIDTVAVDDTVNDAPPQSIGEAAQPAIDTIPKMDDSVPVADALFPQSASANLIESHPISSNQSYDITAVYIFFILMIVVSAFTVTQRGRAKVKSWYDGYYRNSTISRRYIQPFIASLSLHIHHCCIACKHRFQKMRTKKVFTPANVPHSAVLDAISIDSSPKPNPKRERIVTLSETERFLTSPDRDKSGGEKKRQTFQPQLVGGKSSMLSSAMIASIYGWLPIRLHWLDWRRLFTTNNDGTSMITMYDKITNKGPTLLIIRDTNQNVFGVFISENWQNSSEHFFGGADTFIFRCHPSPKRWQWVKQNRWFVLAQMDGITIGGGDHCALSVSSNLSVGVTQRSDTFDNEPLCDTKDFTCETVEVWGFEEF